MTGSWPSHHMFSYHYHHSTTRRLWAATSTTDVQERTTPWGWGSGREHERGNRRKASIHGTSTVFYFLLILLIYSTYSQLAPTNQTRPIDNPFWHDKEGCILLAMSISHLDVTRRATTPLATSISDFSVTRRATTLLATSISDFGVTRRAASLLATSISHFGVTRRATTLLAMSISHFGVTRRAVIGLTMDDARRPGTPVFFYHLLFIFLRFT